MIEIRVSSDRFYGGCIVTPADCVVFFGPQSNTDPRADWDRVVAIQSLIDKDEAIEGIDSADETDVLEVSEVETDSDQELESSDEADEDKSEYCSRDSYIRYAKKPFNRSTTDSLKRKFIAGCNDAACQAQTPVQAWSCLITDAMIDNIVYNTNEFIEKKFPSAGITGDLQENLTNASELKALFGVLYLAGIMRPAFYSSSEMWWADGCGLSIVQLAMTLDRFRFLLKCLRFECTKSEEANSDDKLFPIRRFLENFTGNCKKSYNFGSCAVIDESILNFDGVCSFRKSMKTKLTEKSGIKVYTLVESDTFYTANIEVCVSEKNENEALQTRTTNDLIKKLVSHLHHSGITIVTPPRMTTFSLVNSLTNDCGLNCVGGLLSKRKEIPQAFYSKDRKNFSSVFGFTQSGISLLSYINAKNKACMVISTRNDQYHVRKAARTGAPEALIWYKQRRGAANVAMSLSKIYSVSRRCERWPLIIFFSILDIAAINSQVLWLSNRTQADVIYRRNFIRSLALELMHDHIKTTNASEDKNTGFELDPLLAIRGGPIKNIASNDALLRRHRRCKLCARNADRKTRSYCVACSTPVCKEHYKPLCICCALKF